MRTIKEITLEIRKDWKNVYFGAEPYLRAMGQLYSIEDMYMHESARNIVNRFLANAGTWRGLKAREIKTELKSML